MPIRPCPFLSVLFGAFITAALLFSHLPTATATDLSATGPTDPSIEALSQDEHWLELLAAADASMQSSPDQPTPYLFKIQALRMLGNLAESRRLADTAVQHFADDPEILLERAWTEIFAGDWKVAEADARRAAELAPNLADAALVEGIACRETGRWEQALDAFSRADRLHPNDAVAILNRGRAALELGRRDAAIADFDRSLRLAPDSAEAYFHRGRAYAAKGMLREASSDLSKAIELRPESPAPYVEHGELMGRAGQWRQASEDADTAIALGSQDLRAFLTGCRAAEAREAWVGLEKRARTLIKVFPEESRGHLFLFHALNGQDRKEEALTACNQTIRLAPANDMLLLERANLLIDLHRYPQAIEVCSAVLKKQPVALAYALRGIAWLRQNDLARAEENALNALTLDPDAVTAQLTLAETRLAQGQSREALKPARRAVAQAPELLWAQIVLGKVLLALQEPREAIEAATTAIELAPDDADGYALRARCHDALDNRIAARLDLAEVKRLDPTRGRQLEIELTTAE